MIYLYNKDNIQCLEYSEKLNEVNELSEQNRIGQVFSMYSSSSWQSDSLGLEIIANFLYFFSIKLRQYICIFEELI